MYMRGYVEKIFYSKIYMKKYTLYNLFIVKLEYKITLRYFDYYTNDKLCIRFII